MKEYLFLSIYEATGRDPEHLGKKMMMGGTTFLLNGHMLGGEDTNDKDQTRLMFRVGKPHQSRALKLPGTQQVQMGNRKMGGMIFYAPHKADADIGNALMSLAIEFVEALPPKR